MASILWRLHRQPNRQAPVEQVRELIESGSREVSEWRKEGDWEIFAGR